jgi:SRSO17 transposase
MDSGSDGDSEARFAAYVEQLGTALGHADRQEPLRDYCLGLLMPIERKSVEPMAAVTAPDKYQQSINLCFTLSATRRGRTRRCWPR